MKRFLFTLLLVLAVGAAGIVLWLRGGGGGVVDLNEEEVAAAQASGAAAQEIAVEPAEEGEEALPTIEGLKVVASRERMNGYAERIRGELETAQGEDRALLTVLLSEVERLRGRIDVAHDLATEGAEALPNNSRARHMLAKATLARIITKVEDKTVGSIFSVMGDIKAYTAEVNAAVELDPGNVDARVGQVLAMLIPGLGNKKRAKELIEETGEHDPLRRDFWRGQLLVMDEDRLADAVAEFERLSEAYPGDADVLLTLGELYIKQDAWENAIRAFDQQVVTPRTPHAYRALYQGAKARMKAQRDVEEALAMLEEFEAADPVGEPMPTMDRVKYHKGRALTKLGRYEEAVAALEEAMKLGPKDTGRVRKALEEAQVGLAAKPENAGDASPSKG